MEGLTGPDLLLIGFASLPIAQQEEAYQRIARARLERLAGQEEETARVLRSLARIKQHLAGEKLNSTSYRRAWRELKEGGEELLSLYAVIKHFGSWRQAAEALELSETATARQIQARFEKRRRLGKVWRYSRQTLQDFLAQAVAHYERVPMAAELDAYRQMRIDTAHASGDDAAHFPAVGAYRRRWGSYEKALLALGYTPDQVEERLEQR